jgi:pterin-4a-carbinolamine dehydratase
MSQFTPTPTTTLTHQELVATINAVETALDRMASALHHPDMCPTELARTESPMATVWTLYNHVDAILETYTLQHFNGAVSLVNTWTSLDADGEVIPGTETVTLAELQAEVDREVPRWAAAVSRKFGHI